MFLERIESSGSVQVSIRMYVSYTEIPATMPFTIDERNFCLGYNTGTRVSRMAARVLGLKRVFVDNAR
jgi:hypothetical protein